MSNYIWNRALLIGAIVYGGGLYVFASVAVMGLFVFGMSGYAPGLLCVGELVIGYILAAVGVGWFVARRTRNDFVSANHAYPPRLGAWSGALAVGLPYLVLILLPFVGLSLFPGNWNFATVLGLVIGLLVIAGLGALGGAGYVMTGTKADKPRVYRIVAVVCGAVVVLSVLLFGFAFLGDMQRSSVVSPNQAATRAAYENEVAANRARQTEQDKQVQAKATAATKAQMNASPQSDRIKWRIAMSDSFSENIKNWQEGNRKDFTGKTIGQEFRDGKYRWTLETNKPGGERAISDFWDISVFQVEVTGQRVSGAEDCGYGIFLSPFGFVIRDSGEWFWVDEQDFQSFRPILNGKSDAIQPNHPNRIRVKGNGPNYTLFVNDQWVGVVETTKTEKSDPGVLLDNPRAQTCVVDFDDFEVRVPQ
ncbi:MAG: hypothetical protein HDKAJFGB_03115 [Anaerolineae bacterium]|nr:hypothetical protein [Anaerolineae bacterium]